MYYKLGCFYLNQWKDQTFGFEKKVVILKEKTTNSLLKVYILHYLEIFYYTVN